MTISYLYEIASSETWSFLKVIIHWRGSIWKSVLTELLMWLALYYLIFISYRFLMNSDQQKFFAELANYTYSTTDYLPLTFMLGFFVKIVVDRWKEIFENIGFIDSAAFTVGTLVRGTDPDTVIVRRNILRYLCLTQVLVLRDVSIKVRKRFPNIDSVVQAGFLLPHEREMMEMIEENGYAANYWMPINWACSLVQQMREKGKITGDPQLALLISQIVDFKSKLQNLCNYDWVPVPIAYPQVVFITIRAYFLICCISRQFILGDTSKHRNFDLYFPFMTVIQFIFYMGWLKVAEALLNPLGEDDDDFESNFIIDRNITISIHIADECYSTIPEQRRDNLNPKNGLLYSEESCSLANYPLTGSAKQLKSIYDGVEGHVKMVPFFRKEGGGKWAARLRRSKQKLNGVEKVGQKSNNITCDMESNVTQ